MAQVYLDNNATTKLLPEVRDELRRLLGVEASNASSSQSSGEAARRVLRESRSAVAALIGADPDSIFFTSGGTEANCTVLRSVLRIPTSHARKIVTTTIEHSSVLKTCEALEEEGVEVVRVPVLKSGLVDLDAFRAAVSKGATLASLQWVNNETGAIQPIAELIQECQRVGVLLHTDAAQAVGKLPVRVDAIPVDFLTLTAHKWHGPAGVGAVFVRNAAHLGPLIHGGGQEAGLRAGTENLFGIAGMGFAARLRLDRQSDVCRRMATLRDEFERDLASKIPGLSVNGAGAPRVCNTSSLRFPDVDGEAMLARLDAEDVYCSQGSACEAMRPEPSHVLRAMGLSEAEAYSSIRFSFSELNTADDVRLAVARIVGVYDCLRRLAVESH